MEANGKSYSIIKKELKEKFYMQQIQGAEFLKPNYLLVQKMQKVTPPRILPRKKAPRGELLEKRPLWEGRSNKKWKMLF